MAEFAAGAFSAPALQVAPCGLLSVANVVSYASEDAFSEWIRGFAVLSNAYPTAVRIITIDNSVVTDGQLYDGTGEDRYYDVTPFIVETELVRTGGNLAADSALDSVLTEQATAVAQKAIEFELWDGPAARASGVSGYLTESAGATVVSGAGVAADVALQALEQSISTSPTGSRGTIHMTRDVASALGSRLLFKSKSRDDETAYAVTRLGTLVIIGSGYSGAGPTGATGAAASATNKWMFATGNVDAILGEMQFINTKQSGGFDPRVNSYATRIQQPVAAHFDPSIFAAARITLP